MIFILPSTELGGAEKQAIILAKYFRAEKEFKIHFVCFGIKEGKTTGILKEEKFSYSIVPIYLKFLRFPLTAIGIIRLIWILKKFQPDILMPYCYESNLVTSFLKFSCKNSILIWNQRDDGRGIKKDRLNSVAIKKVDYFIANSIGGQSYLEQVLKISPAKNCVVANGIDKNFEILKEKNWRLSNGFANNAFLVGMVANIHSHKDHLTLLKAWNIFLQNQDKSDQAHLILAGRYGDSYENLKVYIKKNEVNNVTFLGPIDNVPDFLNSIDVSVMASFAKSEGLPNAVLEAMYFSKPVIGSKVSAIKMALGEEMIPWMFPVSDHTFLAAKLEELYLDASLRKEIGEKNKDRVNRYFSSKTLFKNTFKVLSSIIEHSKI